MKRIQRKRTKGWRMPEGAVYVGRPSPWQNPWAIGEIGNDPSGRPWTLDDVLRWFREYARTQHPGWLEPLRGATAMAAGVADHVWSCEEIASLLD